MVRIVTEDWEREAIHRLNHEAFAIEVGQHDRRDDGRLIDRFDAQNTYFADFEDREIQGMIALRGDRPFSLDGKLADLDAYLPAGRRVCEVRLLYVRPPHRNGPLCAQLIGALVHEGRQRGYDIAVISGIMKQQRLYQHLGFAPIGPLVGTPPVLFQPMMVRMEDLQDRCGKILARSPAASK